MRLSFVEGMRNARHIIAIVLSGMISLQAASLLLVDTSYITNHAYIASVLCVNRDKPMMHCDGKCVLKKELNNQQEKESSQKTIHPFSALHFFCEEIPASHFFFGDTNILLPSINFRLSTGFITTRKRPPTS